MGGPLKVHSEDTGHLMTHVPKTSPDWISMLTLDPGYIPGYV